ncbi:hypothetical protein [Aurantiacibacter sp. D1-12]|uniref:hypothetical protein n=1 Tax=Aurantiacibacter sp. D1-12 TaxID=2993658 RepID=UPI00237C7687|nr:hypothetical protein [Aurantiacibacter sp. D1-12]MDE1466124.1 hypothetical protein [Aurantiacibacter sp. D1-12]
MTEARPATPWHLWVIGIVSLLWNAGGIMSYLMTELNMLDSLEMTPDQIAYFSSFPTWAVAFWAMGVWGAFIGSALILLRRKLAVTSFGISIVGLIGTTYYERFVGDLPESFNTAGQYAFAAAIWIITIALFFYARAMTARGVLR